MKKILNILAGLMFILGDLISNTYVIGRDAVKLFFTMNRKDNEFVALFGRRSFVIDAIVFYSVFIIVGYFSVLLALVAMIITFITFYSFKEDWHNKNDKYWKDGLTGGAMMLTGFTAVIFSVYLYTVTPYQYEKVGEITLVQNDITYKYGHNGETREGTHREVDFDFENETSDANLGKCKPGVHTIYEETVQPAWFNYLASDYILSCSGYMEVNKKVGK